MPETLKPVVLPLPPYLPEEGVAEWLNEVMPELQVTGIVSDIEDAANALYAMVSFGIPEMAAGCAALFLPGADPVLVTVFASPDAGEAAEVTKALVDQAGDEIINSADDVIDAGGIKVFRSSRVVVPTDSKRRELAIRGAVAATRPVGGVMRDVCAYFFGHEIDALVTAFWPLAGFLVGDLAEQLILVGESA